MQKLGIDATQLVAQILNVGIILIVFKKFLYRPVLEILKMRRKSIEDNIHLQEQLEAKLEAMEERERELLKKANLTANQIAEKVRKEARVSAESLLAQAHEETRLMRQRAMKEIGQQLETERASLQKHVADTATRVANDALKQLLGRETRRIITESQVKQFVRRVKSPTSRQSQPV